jgi:di/tricarboxylate transporter
MASPISSPQNIIAMEKMTNVTWTQWLIVSIPLCIVSNFIVWLLLLGVYQPHIATPEIMPLRRSEDKFTVKQWFIVGVTICTIFLWCIERNIESLVGDNGVIAILPVVIFFGTGILTKEDFNNFLWTVIVLAMGGIALGGAVENSGLLQEIGGTIKHFAVKMPQWEQLVVFSGMVLVVATFISHTATALIILPIVREVSDGMNNSHPNLLVMGAALMCSGAMGLPVRYSCIILPVYQLVVAL